MVHTCEHVWHMCVQVNVNTVVPCVSAYMYVWYICWMIVVGGSLLAFEVPCCVPGLGALTVSGDRSSGPSSP